tara:strand:+ start:602 stop:1015 length:414 start_codon:yes stop_codon:yes gene_type:complete
MKLIENKDFYNSLDKIIYWSKLFAVLFIIGGAFMALIAIVILVFGSDMDLGFEAANRIAIFIFYGILAAIYIIPGIWLLNFSSKSRKGLNENDENLFVEGFVNLGNYYKFWGIMTVIMLVVYALIFAITIIGGFYTF